MKMNRNKYNLLIFCSRNALYAIALMFSSGTIIQTFLAYHKITSDSIGIHTTALGVINIFATIFFSTASDKTSDIKKIITKLLIPIAICFLGMMLLCIPKEIPASSVFFITLVFGIIQAFFIAVRNIFEYKLPYQIIDLEFYSTLVSVDGIVTGIISISVSLLVSFLLKSFPYSTVMFYCFMSAFVLMILSALLNSCLINKENSEIKEKHKNKQKPKIKELLYMPLFTKLIIPNLLRGIASGVFAMAAVIVLENGFSSSDTTLLVTIAALAAILGSFLFAVLSRHINSRFLCLAGSIAVFSVTLFGTNIRFLFFIAYFITGIGKIIIDYSVPTILYKLLSFERAGIYHAWRLIITTAGTSLATMLVGYLIGNVPIFIILIFAALCQLLSGLFYCFSPVLKSKK